MIKKLLLVLVVVLVLVLFWGKVRDVAKRGDRSLELPVVVTTTTMITDMVTEVVGGNMHIEALMGPGVDPHLYKASASDVRKLSAADVIFYNGLMLEGRMAELFEKMGKQGVKVYAISDFIPREKLLQPKEFEGHFDPHVWMDAKLWQYCVDAVVDGVSLLDRGSAALYKSRGEALKKRYADVDLWIQNEVRKLSDESRILITSHDAYNYFGRAYGFQVVGIQGISTATEAGLADIARMSDFIKANKVASIFVESSVSPNVIKRISNDSGVGIGGELFSDAMGVPGETYKSSSGEIFHLDTWEGMIKYNVEVIVENLK